ncbi:2-aminoethylphosphonate ABC transport system ATP-binding subunit PhnT [Mesorhizobium sp. Root172]|uniref:2-aminoethylphosphonate ABC transport system ATP-binding subunit PhnT n=2 Tax=Phyllobacteriaceae TaxID=69277 RepID=A0AA91F9M5_RHILI|nr:2-aminoethylphosphonate ABC transport system ATP-binding subunit PhnT [Mesorhizobium sp. Root172]OBQ72995.1 2-aminoethylphosphonate ABC transport system ATP-binding subunit PhnT [Mesorhizobium loti]
MDIDAAKIRGAGSNVHFDKVSVAYGAHVVLHPLTLDIAPGEILAMIGPSGSGKTTALRAVAGFVRPASGRIRIGATDVTDLPPYERGLGMVVQNYALFPHMRVEDNVAFGLRAQGADKALIAERVRDALGTVGMATFARRYPRELSGGQQQRVAIARALAVRPRVLLLDEPLSALDAQIRRNMVEEIARLHRSLPGLTILYVTHDQTEALTLADKIAIMRDGRVCSHGPTTELYRRPPNRFTAEFLGRANLLPVTVAEGVGSKGFATARHGDAVLVGAGRDEKAGDKSLLCIRPQHLSLTADSEHTNRIVGTLREVHWQGELTHLVLDVEGTPVRVSATKLPIALPELGARVPLFFAPADTSLLPEDAGV